MSNTDKILSGVYMAINTIESDRTISSANLIDIWEELIADLEARVAALRDDLRRAVDE